MKTFLPFFNFGRAFVTFVNTSVTFAVKEANLTAEIAKGFTGSHRNHAGKTLAREARG
jgi:hypothetical protein